MFKCIFYLYYIYRLLYIFLLTLAEEASRRRLAEGTPPRAAIAFQFSLSLLLLLLTPIYYYYYHIISIIIVVVIIIIIIIIIYYSLLSLLLGRLLGR